MSVFSDVLDGAQAVVGLKSDVTMDNWAKRLGAIATVATATKFIDNKFVVGPAAKRNMSASQYNQFKGDTIGGGFFLPA